MQERYENTEICKKCEGVCCKSMGCHLSPEDIKGGVTYDSLKLLLDAGFTSIDFWDGNPLTNNWDDEIGKVSFLRMRNKNAPIVDYCSWGGACSLLTDTGCPLSYEDRPKGARLLVPGEYHQCVSKYKKQQCAIDWMPYQDILNKLERLY